MSTNIFSTTNQVKPTTFIYLLQNLIPTQIKCADQILLREELDELDKEHSNFKLHHTIDAILDEMGWRHFIGHINAQMIKKVMPTQILRNETTATMVCGPPPMVKFLREELSGLEAQNVHKF